jgi:hypothetical protein
VTLKNGRRAAAASEAPRRSATVFSGSLILIHRNKVPEPIGMRVSSLFTTEKTMAKKLDFLINSGGQIESIKARIFEGANGVIYASIQGDIFDGVASGHRLDQLIAALQEVREAVRKGADDET